MTWISVTKITKVTTTSPAAKGDKASREMTPDEEAEFDKAMEDMDNATGGVWASADRLFKWASKLAR